jgi:putative Holliday junction resolvase
VTLMAIDYGSKRIGIAVSDSGVLATPHSVVRNEGDIVARLAQLALDLDADTIILGLPRRPKSDRHEKTYRELAEQLRQKTCKDVVLWDETLTTSEAAARLREAGRSRRDNRDIDMHAAAVILQSYIDAHADGRPS